VGSEALTGEGCWGGQSRGVVAALSSFQCSCARKKGEGEKGVVATVTRREKRRMEGLTRYGPSTAARAGGGTPPTAGRRGSRGCRQRGQE
jgi:hypothetical protein